MTSDLASKGATGSEGRDAEVARPEIVRLVHHIELNRSGWWDQALERLTLVTLWLAGRGRAQEIAKQLGSTLGTNLTVARVEGILEQLHASGSIVELSAGDFKATEEVSRALGTELEAADQQEARLSQRLADSALQHGVAADGEKLWNDFDRLYLYPLLRDAGARTYALLLPRELSDEASDLTSGSLLEPLCEAYGEEIRSALIDFLDPNDAEVRSYVLRRMNGQLALDAAGLDHEVLESFRPQQGRLPRVNVLVDTNFLFSILELHDNPSNEVARDLLALEREIREFVDVRLYVLSITLDETRRVLREVIVRLSNVTPARSVAAAAREAIHSSGLVTRYLDAAASSPTRSLTAEDFFGPYERNPLTVLRERGVELFNEPLDSYGTDQEVIDDIHDQTEFQTRVRKRGPKPYEANFHDMALWHFTNRKRPTHVDSPLDVGFWIATVDYGLIAFDRHKRKNSDSPPVCLTPASLIQLLQFWAPRTDALDRAVVGAIREPLLFLDFDATSETTTLRIIRELSRFQGVDDLSPALLKRVLLNDALRARLSAATTPDTQRAVELIQAAVVEESRHVQEEADRLRHERDQALAEKQEQERERVAEVDRLEGEAREREAERRSLDQTLADTADDLRRERDEKAAAIETLEKRQTELHEKMDALQQERENAVHRRADRRRLWKLSAVSAVLLIALAGLLTWLLAGRTPSDWFPAIGAPLAALLAWLLVVEHALGTTTSYASGRAHRVLSRVRNGTIAFLLAVAASIVAVVIIDTWNHG